MANPMQNYDLVSDEWALVADGKPNVTIQAKSPQTFCAYTGASEPSGYEEEPQFVGGPGEPITLTNLDADTKVYLRAAGLPAKVVVMT